MWLPKILQDPKEAKKFRDVRRFNEISHAVAVAVARLHLSLDHLVAQNFHLSLSKGALGKLDPQAGSHRPPLHFANVFYVFPWGARANHHIA
jgi:hypothetical protein